jgi:predicted amidohydrolase
MKIKLATAQFPVSADIQDNLSHVLRQMKEASELRADVIHFPEGALSGYAGVDFSSFAGYDWSQLQSATKEVMAEAAALKLWVVLGSSHSLSEGRKPHNSLYIISDQGKIADRYDKRFCSGTEAEGDLLHYSPGNYFCRWTIKGVGCGALICYDYRFPELYREYKKLDVAVMFHSFHAGNMDPKRRAMMEQQVGERFHALNPGKTYPEITMPATLISYAANNFMWISAANTSAAESCWPAMVLRPDGVIINKSVRNQTSVLISEVDTNAKYYDSTRLWRARAMQGIYHSGVPVDDPRSDRRQAL